MPNPASQGLIPPPRYEPYQNPIAGAIGEASSVILLSCELLFI